MINNTTAVFNVHPDDWAEFAKQLSEETDRAAALLAAAFLDRLVAALIEGFLVEDRKSTKALLKGSLAPLENFYARIALAYSLGLITQDEHHDLNIVREVRNLFAHELEHSSFNKEVIETQVRKLRVPNLMPKSIYSVDRLGPRRLFIDSAAMLSTFLDKRRRMISDRRTIAPKFYIELK